MYIWNEDYPPEEALTFKNIMKLTISYDLTIPESPSFLV